MATPTSRNLITASRHASAWHRLTPDVVGCVAEIVEEGDYDVVLPGGDSELLALSEARDEINSVIPYGTRESVRCILDKLSLSEAAESAGIATPRTWVATDEALDAVDAVVVLKSRSHATTRAETLVSADRRALRAAANAMREDGLEPVLQEHRTGPLSAISVALGAEGEILAAVQQRSTGLWPPEAGISTRAETVPADDELIGRLADFLAGIGWQGLAEAQFIDSPDGPLLIDVNGRCYGSLALAAAAGVDLAAIWAASALGDRIVSGPARPGVRYQWLYGDLRRGWRTGHDLLGPLAYARRAAHSVWSPRDLRPASSYLGSLARSATER